MDELDMSSILLGVPEDTANLLLPNPDLRDFYRDEQERIYWIDSQIDDSTLNVIKFILRCNKEDKNKPIEQRKRILIMIDSPGGSVEVEQSIIGAIHNSKTPVWTCCYCTAFSAAADLLACGHVRLAMPFVNIMFHAGSARYEGTQADIESAKKFYDKMNKRVNDEVFARVNFDAKTLKKLKNENIYFNEIEALELNIIDKIVKDFDEII